MEEHPLTPSSPAPMGMLLALQMSWENRLIRSLMPRSALYGAEVSVPLAVARTPVPMQDADFSVQLQYDSGTCQPRSLPRGLLKAQLRSRLVSLIPQAERQQEAS